MTKMMTEERLNAIRERCEKAPAGPWSNIGDWAIIRGTNPNPNHGDLIGSVNKEAAEFIAHAREDIPALLDEIERLKAAEPREEVKKFAGEMEKVLRKNDHKSGWENCAFSYLAERIESNLTELRYELNDNWDARTFPEVINHATDIANFAMMIASNARKMRGISDV